MVCERYATLVLVACVLTIVLNCVGRNKRTGQVGDFPGSTYAELVREVAAETPPKPPPRRKVPLPSPNAPWSGEQPPPIALSHRQSLSPPLPQAHALPQAHDLFKVTVQLPVKCDVCKLFTAYKLTGLTLVNCNPLGCCFSH